MMAMGASAAFTLRYVGFDGRLAGRYVRAALIAACTSRAAALMLRLRSNCSEMLVEPVELFDVISLTPAMCPNCRSSGVATDEAITSGLAPGRLALMLIVGMSICGSGETGSTWNAMMPAIAMAIVSRMVAIGRLMKMAEKFTMAPSTAAAAASAQPNRRAGNSG